MKPVHFSKGLVWGLCILFMATPVFAGVGRTAEISNTDGAVWYRKGGTTEWKGAEKGMVLMETDEIKTGANAKAVIILDAAGETGKLDLTANSQLRLETMKKNPATMDKTTVLDLAVGKVLVKAEKIKGNSTFQVKTPTSICGVRGTLFEVSVEANQTKTSK